MKLRNKRTGEIVSLDGEITYDNKVRLLKHYDSLAELCEDWEDYEEPKGYWYIDSDGDIMHEPSDDRCEFDNNCREIGNYFETQEEAELAVEKLKAITRLKNKGLVFRHHEESTVCGQITDLWISADFGNKPVYFNDVTKEDLDLIFGGKE